MEQLIPIASKLQDVLGALGQSTTLNMPQIVVVGGQSSGKSSVLEGIVGRSFLPRGHGIVTRRPLVLQLYNTSATPPMDTDEDERLEEEKKVGINSSNDKTKESENIDTGDSGSANMDEWGEFLHLPGKRFHSFALIRSEITRDTERLVGTNKGINSKPIHLKIYSPRVLSLTLVDLPGIAKVAIGDQPPDIEDQIQNMCLEYISNPNAIILAVTSANTDLANSDALKLAQSVDPYRERTVGVLTKLDLMDPGTDASDMIHNKVIPLRRGYVGIVNRGQRDVDADLSIREGLRKEEHFFRTHPVYSRDRSLLAKCGTNNMAKSLNNILMHHIRECLPELKNRITNMMADVQSELDALGAPTDDTSGSTALGGHLLALLSKFTTNFASMIDGRGGHGAVTTHASSSNATGTNELYGGARISYIFNDVFTYSLMTVGAFDGLTDAEIRTTISNANGTRPALFVPEISFDILVRRQISRLEQPGLQCVDLVYEELQRMASQCEPTELTRFPKLRDRMVETVSGLLRRCVGPTHLMVGNLVKIELAYINTSHPDFIGGSRAVAHLMDKVGKDERTGGMSAPSSSENEDEIEGVGASSNKQNGAVGATPLSSSSRNDYCRGDEENRAIAPTSTIDESGGGGIMNLLFGGNRNYTTNPNNSANTNGFRSPSRRNVAADVPPSIVQLPQVPHAMRHSDVPPTDRERVETEIIKSLIESYFSIVRKNFIDMVPKTIMYFLVNHVRDAMQNELVSELYRDAEVPTLMKEAEDIAQRRKTCIEMKELLMKALEIVNEVRDFNTFK
mmetsp:Transcript_16012/g.22935  ORF Transcript_16012/g.22935 Transcript_16012/m.22935 type:complete len:795 (+) Transcript_16012:47-2431(+)